ncbi:putative protein FAM47D, partial [Nannospalax galili]|uniref:putative protein FAM47D n=1 Tax=Nannospalax galili TaxID=1026970 RepID=UPI0004ED11CD
SRRWVFVKEGLDDFRKGCPPCEDVVIRGPNEGFLPTISHGAPHHDSRKGKGYLGPLSPLSLSQQAQRDFAENTEANLTHHPLDLWPQEKDFSSGHLLNLLEVLDPDQKLEDKWAYCEDHRESIKLQPMKEEYPQKPVEQDPPKFPGSLRYGVLHKKKPKKQKDTDSLYYRYMPKGLRGFCEWADTFGETGIDEEYMMKEFDIFSEWKPSYGDSAIKKISLLPSELKYFSMRNKVKEIRFSMEESNFERKLGKPHDPYKSTKEKIRYGAWYLKPNLWKKLVNDEPLIDPKVLLELEGGLPGKPDIIEDLYGAIAFKDFIISKGYRMPVILEKLFKRKGWDYDTVNTPIPRVVKAHELIMQKRDEDYDDGNA